MKKSKNIIWGVILVAIGLIAGCNVLGIADINIFFDGWWTLFIIIPCFVGLITDDDKTGNLIGLIIGAGLLLICQDILSFELVWKMLLPIILVIIGLSMIFKDTIGGKVAKEIKKLNKENGKKNEYCAVFSGEKVNFDGQQFEGAEINAIFGGVKLDLRNADITSDVVISACAVFGGVDIFVPENVDVKVKSTSIFGGTSDKTKHENGDAPVVYVDATCIFGGVDVK
ncbi:MAG: LiaF transmembrane domain-containing protein [Lachnospiraceae bacterium]